jgi:hypothetical protein
MITLRRESTEVAVILHNPLEQVNGKQRAFGAYGQEGCAVVGHKFSFSFIHSLDLVIQ